MCVHWLLAVRPTKHRVHELCTCGKLIMCRTPKKKKNKWCMSFLNTHSKQAGGQYFLYWGSKNKNHAFQQAFHRSVESVHQVRVHFRCADTSRSVCPPAAVPSQERIPDQAWTFRATCLVHSRSHSHTKHPLSPGKPRNSKNQGRYTSSTYSPCAHQNYIKKGPGCCFTKTDSTL